MKWGPERPHDGSDKCPAEARYVECSIFDRGKWLGVIGGVNGKDWAWKTVTAYRLPADVPMPAPADPVRDALVDAGKGLRRIVEEIDGAMIHGTWRDDHGRRLKDTPEWVAFYNAMTDAKREKP